jgi:hypothetical protein
MADPIATFLGATLEIYRQTARRTGRTLAMMDAVKDGDRVVCPNNDVKRHIKYLAAKAGKTISVVVNDPLKIDPRDHIIHSIPGTTHFEHTWIEAYFAGALAQESARLEKIVTYFNPERPPPITDPRPHRERMLDWSLTPRDGGTHG